MRYLSFTLGEVTESSGHVAARRRGFVIEADERLTDSPNVVEVLRSRGWGSFVGPVFPSETFAEFPEELLRGAVIHGVEGDKRFWVIPFDRDPEEEVPKVHDE